MKAYLFNWWKRVFLISLRKVSQSTLQNTIVKRWNTNNSAISKKEIANSQFSKFEFMLMKNIFAPPSGQDNTP